MGDNSAATFSWQPLPDIAFCAKRQRLRETLCEAMQQLIMLQDQRFYPLRPPNSHGPGEKESGQIRLYLPRGETRLLTGGKQWGFRFRNC